MKIRRLAPLGLIAPLFVTSPLTFAQEVGPSESAPPETAAGVPDSDIAAPAQSPPASTASSEAAPEAATAPASRVHGSRILEEIVVTAQKREENLKDVPISVAAFSGDKLEALGIDNTKQLPQITPGMQFDSVVGFNLIFLRGIGTENFLPGSETSVATYVDGVYLPFNGVSQDFGKVQRVEVLKGPQGTLFGRNVTGGAINIISQKPSREFSGTASAEAGTFDSRKFKAYLTGPIGDSVQFSLSAVAGGNDPYYKRPAGSTLAPYPTEQAHGVQFRLNWDITEDLSFIATAQTSRQKGLGGSIFTSTKVKPAFTAIVPSYDEPYVSDPDTPSYFRAQSYLQYGELRWNSPYFFDLRVFGSHQEVTTGLSIDFEGSSAPLVTFNPKDQGGKYNSFELQFTSNKNGWLSDRLKWVGGYYYFHSYDAGMRHLTLNVGQSLTDPTVAAPLTALHELVNSLDLGNGGLGIPAGVSVHLTGLMDGVSNAVYGQGTYNFTDQLALTLGARLSEENRSLTQSTIGVEYASNAYSPPLVNFSPQHQESKDVSPKATLDYKLFDDSLLYASFQQGFKSGSYNVVNITKPPSSVKPEKLIAYEVGLKGTLLDGTFQYSTAAFQYHIHDLQTLTVSLQNSGAITLENAGRTQIRGADVDVTWQPLPDSLPGFVVTGSGAYLKGEYTSYPNASGFNALGVFVNNLDYTGNTTTRTPKYSFNSGLNYRFEFADSALETGVSIYHNAGYYFNAGNTIKQNAYSLLNAQASYSFEPWGMRFSLIGQNLTKTVYLANAFETDFNTVINYASPRTVLGRIEFMF